MNTEIIAMIKDTFSMFVFLATELAILFLVISYLVGVLQEFITPQKIQSILGSKNGKGYGIAALLGSITPFCSCSTIPFLKGLLRARAGFGPMMVFLFASPLLNPIIIGLFVVTFGIKVALFYFMIAMSVAVLAGYVLEKLRFERYVKDEAYHSDMQSGCSLSQTKADKTCLQEASVAVSCCETETEKQPEPKVASCSDTLMLEAQQQSRWMRIWFATWKDFKQVLPYLMLGISVGALIYGFVPTDLVATYAGKEMWYAVPVAAVIGIPLYIRAEAVIPLSAALVSKGMALGPVMALIIGSAGASLTEVILLKSIFKNQMIAAFLVVILGMAVGAGYLYSFILA